MTILSSPVSIGDEKFNVTIQTEGASAGTNYLRVDLYQDGTTKYFGDTDNGQAWYNGSDGKQYFPVTILSNTPNIATVSARIGEPSISDYPGPGSYKLRIRRYTSSGNQGSEDPQPVSINLTKNWPSPSPSPTPTPTSTPTQTPTPTPSPSPTPTPTPTPKPSLKPASPSGGPSSSSSPNLASPESGTVAGAATEIDLSGFGISPPVGVDPRVDPPKPTLNKSRAKTALIVGSGLVIISVAGFLGYRKYDSLYNRKA